MNRGYGPARVSCEECRRMKSRCDKRRPCGPCVRRGCADICPNGTLPTRRVFRSMYADKEALQLKLDPLCNRIQQLEEALSLLSLQASDEPHPLLSEELRALILTDKSQERSRDPASTSQTPSHSPPPPPLIETWKEDFGTLTVDEDGRTKYFGRSAGPEILIQVMREEETIPPSNDNGSILSPRPRPTRPSLASYAPPLHSYDEQFLSYLESRLPSYPRASALCETYLEHSSWFFGPIQRDELINEIFTPIYNSLAVQRRGGARTYNPIKLAVFFLVLSHGAITDLTLPPYNDEAEGYYQAGSSMISMSDVTEAPSIEIIQAFGYMGTYHSLCEPRHGLSSAWPLIAVAIKMSQSAGLHVDGALWKLDPITVYRRRLLFWELVAQELPMSLGTGRPPSMHLDFTNCKLPVRELKDAANIIDEHGVRRYSFVRDVLWQAIKLTIGSQVPSYSAILELDRKISAGGPLPGMGVKGGPLSESPSLSHGPPSSGVPSHSPPSVPLSHGAYTGRLSPPTSPNVLLGIFSRCYVQMYIHRPFFAKAFLDYPADPMHSPYGVSVRTTYAVAQKFFDTLKALLQGRPILCQRFFFLWLQAFSAAIAVGFVATKIPEMDMARGAFEKLSYVIELFEQGGAQSHRAQMSLVGISQIERSDIVPDHYPRQPILRELHRKAYVRLVHTPGSAPEFNANDAADHLSSFVGRTKFKLLSSQNQSPASSAGSLESNQDDVHVFPGTDLTPLYNWDQDVGALMQSDPVQDTVLPNDALTAFGAGASYDVCRSYLDFVPRNSPFSSGYPGNPGRVIQSSEVPVEMGHMAYFSDFPNSIAPLARTHSTEFPS
ncbi:hypothetical protein NEOLEDRAFT_1089468 [Neolentinus lepideus HHB14362 ss-1]|uniref:Zn(2)-C6 fungal-type domain-containing protein n=1 Tax=Neolentinus lepideus HHB14362 ss-1 TaxID=1314782 RepID=A0A165TW96_9AGAM|nr:hypothetical protein NEOLEDRAFT_1089468 [Neolentinus lepideus HHB14362 ss-1]